MDEIPECFDSPTNHRVVTKSVKTVFITTTGHMKTRFIVVLNFMAGRTHSSPVITFKRLKVIHFPSGIIIRVHPKDCMDENVILGWLKNVWFEKRYKF